MYSFSLKRSPILLKASGLHLQWSRWGLVGRKMFINFCSYKVKTYIVAFYWVLMRVATRWYNIEELPVLPLPGPGAVLFLFIFFSDVRYAHMVAVLLVSCKFIFVLILVINHIHVWCVMLPSKWPLTLKGICVSILVRSHIPVISVTTGALSKVGNVTLVCSVCCVQNV